MHYFFFFLLLVIQMGCIRCQYEKEIQKISQSDYFLVILVNARHLDYTNNVTLLQTIAKHPSDGSKNGDVGHAWIYLQGFVDGQPIFLEGGHSGELGIVQPKYFDGVMDYLEVSDPNPIRYLWQCQHDGYFEWGNGDHWPTYAAKVDLTPEQFDQILQFIEQYPFSDYSLAENQCSSFVTQIAMLADLTLEDKVNIPIAPFLNMEGKWFRLWTSPQYEYLVLSSPDILERSLIQAVEEGRAANAMQWYAYTHRTPIKKQLTKTWETLQRLPERLSRYKRMSKLLTNSEDPSYNRSF